MGGKGAKIDLKMEEIGKDLITLADLFDRYFSTKVNATPIRSAGSSFKKIREAGIDYWTYSIHDLIFRDLDLGRKTLPEEIIDPTLTLKVDLVGTYPKDYTHIIDPFARLKTKAYTIQFVMNAQSFDLQGDVIDLKNAWHLDQHFEDTEASFFHPFYHLHQGGYELTNENKDNPAFTTGNLVILESPRLMHHPMDGIMAIDFVIRNFYEVDTHQLLTDLKTYNQLLKKAHDRFLRPYILSLASNWVHFGDATYDVQLKPNLILPNL